MNKIGFGGGCHWCTEAVFQALKGVRLVEQGWIASSTPYDAFSEAVIVHFDSTIMLRQLVEIHLLTHSSTKLHNRRNKYRSAVYYFNPRDRPVIQEIIASLAAENSRHYITQVLPFVAFKLNEESYLNYYEKNRDKPFCKTYIEPKLKAIRAQFGSALQADVKVGKNGQNNGQKG